MSDLNLFSRTYGEVLSDGRAVFATALNGDVFDAAAVHHAPLGVIWDRQLYELDVYDQAASNQTLEQIGKLPKLRLLMLVNGTFDDGAVKHLANLTTLEEVSLDSSKMTEAAIDDLTGLRNLRKLHLGRVRISAAAAMPLLIYFFWAPHHAPPYAVTFGSLAAALLIVYKHDANIQRMVQGDEPKFSFSKKQDAP